MFFTDARVKVHTSNDDAQYLERYKLKIGMYGLLYGLNFSLKEKLMDIQLSEKVEFEEVLGPTELRSRLAKEQFETSSTSLPYKVTYVWLPPFFGRTQHRAELLCSGFPARFTMDKARFGLDLTSACL
jgi:hypothetical protein